MELRNWELFAVTANPVVGATVEVREAILGHPNTTTVIAAGVTNSDGMYAFTGLPEGPKDIKITYSGKIKWVKGMAQHSISLIIGEDFVPPNVNLLKNGGLDIWRQPSYQLTTVDVAVALGWLAQIGAGDTGVMTQEAAIIAPNSQYSAKLAYIRVAGPAYLYQALPTTLVYALRGHDITLTFPTRQGVASSAQACILENGVETVGATNVTTGSFGTLSVSKTVGAGATSLYIGAKVLLTDTLYFDNATLVLGAVAGVYQPRISGAEVDQVDYAMLDRVFARHFLLS